MEQLIVERSVKGRRAFHLAPSKLSPLDPRKCLGEHFRTEPAELPEVSEFDVVRHFTRLSQMNYSVDTQFYPLGSCTMKYNPKLNERVAAMDGFAQLHPLQPVEEIQGSLRLLDDLEQWLCEITGMQAMTLQPAAGAQGELTGLKIIAAYHRSKDNTRSVILIPDSAHGTNPASAALSNFTVRQVKSGADGLIDLEDLRSKMSDEVAGLMLTNPNTLGLFEKNIESVAAILHERDALVYMDGANMNALLGVARPGDMGVDLIQLNLHKTFSTPHGGGGPGAGPVGVVRALEPFLPSPRIAKTGDGYAWAEPSPLSIGRVHGFYGNVGVLVRAYTYIRTLGAEGIARAGKVALINANYVQAGLQSQYPVPFGDHCMHEFVATAKALKAYGVTAGDVVKRLLDYGFYAPTVYFPLIVEEALMIEPTETESKETLDRFVEAMRKIAEEAKTNPELVQKAPHHLSVGRVDEVRAARTLTLRWKSAKSKASENAGRQAAQTVCG